MRHTENVDIRRKPVGVGSLLLSQFKALDLIDAFTHWAISNTLHTANLIFTLSKYSKYGALD